MSAIFQADNQSIWATITMVRLRSELLATGVGETLSRFGALPVSGPQTGLFGQTQPDESLASRAARGRVFSEAVF